MTESLDVKPNNYQNIEEILKVTALSTKKILKCDRVIIYDASELPAAEIIAESVNSKYASILGQKIIDPFLSGEYLELYCYGQTVAIDDLNSADVSKNQLESLEQLNVKSLAIAPICLGNELLAFLVAHQFSKPQTWDSEAINLLAEQANTASLAFSKIAMTEKSNSDTNFTKQKIDSLESHKLPSRFRTGSDVTVDQKQGNSPTMDRKEKSNGNSNSDIQNTEQKTMIQEDQSRSFAEVKEEIANELGSENILNTTVNELRHLLKCDRVVVYSLNQDSYGEVIAESVAMGWTKALGRIIDDPCFAARYIEQYRNGRLRAWDDIYREYTTSCYLEQLEALEVKANLVAPIIKEGQLFGLLIAHHCSDTHNWQEQEINWISEIATQIGLLLEYSGMVAENDQQESQPLTESEIKWNQHFTDAIQYIRQSLTEEDILKASVKEVRRILNCDRVVVYSMNQDDQGTIVAESVAASWTKALGRVIDDPCFEAKYLDQYRDGRVRAWNNIYESGLTRCYIEQLEQLEVKANLVTPILNEGKLFGLLVAHQCSDFRNWQQLEVRWVAQIATQVGFALDNAKLLADAKQLQYQLQNEVQLTKYFTDATRYIRESLHQEDILEVSVEEVRRVLNCDRVVVYSLNSDNHGLVSAESVAPGWTRAQGRIIKDPCFEANYLEKYRNGRVRSWSNIYQAGMTRCYIEQLEQLEVKANLVTPIISEGKLFGLLVAHHCADFRKWQQSEIRWVTQVATQVGFALDNAQLLVDAQGLRQQVEDEGKWTEYFTDTVQHIRQSLKSRDILKTSVREIQRILNCDRVVIYSLNSDNHGTIIAESVAAGWTRAKGLVIKDPCFEARYLEMYRNGRVRAWNNIYESGMTGCYIEQLEKLEIKANLVAPIINGGKLFGLLVAHQCSAPRNWQQSEIRWVAQIATQVGLALDNAKLLEQLKQSVSHQQHEQTEILKHQVVEILAENGNAYQTLSQEAMLQSETIINVLHQIHQVADLFNEIALNVQQLKFQEQQNDLALKDTKESINRSINSISNIQHTVQNVAVGFDNLTNSSQQLSETLNTIKDVSKQIVQQSMSITRIVNRSQIEIESQNSIIDLSDKIFSLIQQLFEATARVEPLFSNVRTEVMEKTIALDSGTQQLINGVGDLETVCQKLERVVSLNTKISNLIAKISQAVENQSQSSTFAKDSVQEVASIAERISEQSMSITQSFNQLVILIQKL
ncbi:GAF domain-containing protein [Pleurocapsa sp. PCC 7319]|uniref:GAF domain-containing protein n=1 Tax=Pleurocapsa sp. PCC 7319 TaxID=118161 RepID=UPI0003474480|nr:GAF domain-containing protein [Pleurocapsa sp. PCC 7319]